MEVSVLKYELRTENYRIKILEFAKKKKEKHSKTKKGPPQKVKIEISKIVYHYFGLFEMQNFICKREMKNHL